MGTQTCPSCGNTLAADARFCNRCGKTLSQTGEIAASPPKSGKRHGLDPMKAWWITFGVILFVSLFVPLGMRDGRLMMFWNLFKIDANYSAWLIVNAVLGTGIFIITLIFLRGIARGCVMGGSGLVGFILYIALISGFGRAFGNPAPFILFSLGQLCLGLVLGSAILRQNRPKSLIAILTGTISGGITAVIFVIGTILLLIKTSGNWASIVTNISGGLFCIIAIVAGILSLAVVGNPKSLQRLLKAIIILVWVYIGSLIIWYLLLIILPSIAFGTPIGDILLGILPMVVLIVCWIVYLLLFGFGFVEVFL